MFRVCIQKGEYLNAIKDIDAVIYFRDWLTIFLYGCIKLHVINAETIRAFILWYESYWRCPSDFIRSMTFSSNMRSISAPSTSFARISVRYTCCLIGLVPGMSSISCLREFSFRGVYSTLNKIHSERRRVLCVISASHGIDQSQCREVCLSFVRLVPIGGRSA